MTPYIPKLFDKVAAIDAIIAEMLKVESKYVTYKKNAGKKQESIKFPVKYRQQINNAFFPKFARELELLHNNYEVSNEKE